VPFWDEGYGEKLPDGFVTMRREELLYQIASPVHHAADRAKAEGLHDPEVVQVRSRQLSFFCFPETKSSTNISRSALVPACLWCFRQRREAES
jgi:hypothetical protein